MSLLAIIAVVLGLLVVVFFVGGLIAVRRRRESHAEELLRKIQAADQALEAARAADRGWDRAKLEEAVQAALRERHPDFRYHEIHLVHVEDRPGIEEDRAHMVAKGADGERHVVLVREGDRWLAHTLA